MDYWIYLTIILLKIGIDLPNIVKIIQFNIPPTPGIPDL